MAAARVRSGDLRGAIAAYREADRRAPRRPTRPRSRSRLGWLSKELGDKGAAGRYFSKARGDAGFSFAMIVVAVTAIVSLVVDLGGPQGTQLGKLLMMDKVALAAGELWRMWTVTLVHARCRRCPCTCCSTSTPCGSPGPFVERLYGRGTFLVLYLLFAAVGARSGRSPSGRAVQRRCLRGDLRPVRPPVRGPGRPPARSSTASHARSSARWAA